MAIIARGGAAFVAGTLLACGGLVGPLAATDGGLAHDAATGAFSDSPGYDSALVDASLDSGESDIAPGGCRGDGPCLPLGTRCELATDCCTGYCSGGFCSGPTCAVNGDACTNDTQCCSGSCGAGGTCEPSPTCRVLGASCSQAQRDCCSGYCYFNVCSCTCFCGQRGDSCVTSADCCAGICEFAPDAVVGTCGPPLACGSD